MHLEQVTAPTSEPISLAEAKLHCRVDVSDDDTWFTTAIAAARRCAETQCDRCFVTQTWRQTRDGFPSCDARGSIVLAKTPVASVSSVKYIDADGVLQTLDASKYTADTLADPCEIVPAYGESWPSTRAVPNAVTVEYVVGVAAEQVDPRAKMAMLLTVAHWYENRESVLVGTVSKEIELAFRHLAAQMWNGTL
mgnify:CR=1 FL=1